MVLFDDNYYASEEQFCRDLQKQDFNIRTNKSGVVLKCENGVAYTDISDKHTLLFGNTGSKKTRCFCIPSVFAIGSAGESIIVSDPKGEIFEKTSGYLSSVGYNIRVLNFRNPKLSECWNPLTVPYRFYMNGDKDKALEILMDLVCQFKAKIHSEKDIYWEEIASNMFFSIVLMLFEAADSEEEVNIASVIKIRDYLSSPKKEEQNIFWDLVNQFKNNIFIKAKLNSILSIKDVERTLDCVLSVFDSMFQDVLINRGLLSMISRSSFDYDEIFTQKTIMYLVIPDEKTTFHFLTSIFIKQMYEYLIDKSYTLGGKMPIRVNYILDEFSNLPTIKDMASMISAARSRNIRFFLIVQSAAQLEHRYKEEAKTIKSNCSTWIFLASREIELLNEISKLCGEVYIDGRGYRPLLSVSSLQCLTIDVEDSEVLILRNNLKPYISWVKDYLCYPQSNFHSIDLENTIKDNIKIFSVPKYMVKRIKSETYNTVGISDISLDDIM